MSSAISLAVSRRLTGAEMKKYGSSGLLGARRLENTEIYSFPWINKFKKSDKFQFIVTYKSKSILILKKDFGSLNT